MSMGARPGVHVVAVTPFLPDESLDLASLVTLLEFCHDAGAQGILILGVMGEADRLADVERVRVIDTVVTANERRLQVTVGDGLAYLRSTPVRYDLVAMDLTDPVGPAVELYSAATFALARGALAEGGALVLHVGSPFSHPDRVRRTISTLRSVFPLVTPYFVHIPIYGSIWGFAVASSSLDPREVEPAEVESRLAARGVKGLRYYNGDTHRAVFALPNYVKSLLA